ncbi:hypothetical protein LCGC14_2454630 [marine sediment metagenome]|uniref:Uncharacterized protein n=1 Tax=marine sediment metagenome TaxID=412755 RepID=A0A0F9BF11_9ZZZZ
MKLLTRPQFLALRSLSNGDWMCPHKLRKSFPTLFNLEDRKLVACRGRDELGIYHSPRVTMEFRITLAGRKELEKQLEGGQG